MPSVSDHQSSSPTGRDIFRRHQDVGRATRRRSNAIQVRNRSRRCECPKYDGHYDVLMSKQAEIEDALLKEVIESMESRYDQDGRPPHHQPSAREIEYDPEGSKIFVCEYERFLNLSTGVIQDIFRHRHILVVNVPVEEPVHFDASGLMNLGSLENERQVQGKFIYPLSLLCPQLTISFIPVAHLRDMHKPSEMLRNTSIQVMLDIANSPDSKLVLNLLDCPMGGASHPPPPRFAALASDNKASAMTKGEPLVGTKHLADDLCWATAAHKYASSWPHVDDEGFSTSVEVQTGSKFWAVAVDKPSRVGDAGDMATIEAYGKDWEAFTARSEVFDYEGVLLTPTSVL